MGARECRYGALTADGHFSRFR